KNDNDKLDAETIVVNTIKEIGGSCTKSNLQEILKWPMYRIDLTISNSYKLVPWGENQVILFNDIGLTDEQKAGLLNLVNRSMTDGYTSIGVVYKELMFDRHLSALISQKGIDNKSKLAAIIKILKPTLRGHTNFMYEEGCMFTSFEEVILHHFNEGASRREIQNFALEHGYGDIMAGNLLSRLIEQEELIELDFDLLYPAHAFEISEEAVNQVIHFIEEQMKGKEYISLSNLKGYRRKLPSINFRWNPYLMKSILLKNNYRQINKIYRDYRYDRVLLVKKDSKIQTFEELVHFVLKEEYSGNMHEMNVYDFLVEKGVFREQDYAHNKVLPHEIKGYSNLVNVDNIGIVTLG
ncbi:hypothetical protein V7Y60_26705, partial [Priestia megaterium]|uniref:hypothetical protein n=1 Tax=Priestia megaterium TaxID=1404 RepID=UPI002FFDEC58